MTRLFSLFSPKFRLCLTALLPLSLFLGLFSAPHAQARENKETVQPKTALVLLTFGTTYEQTSDPLEPVRREITARHPDIPLSVAYSSAHVLKSLRAKGKPARNLAQVLADLSAEGYTHIAVQSLHVVPGLEADLAGEIITRFQDMPKGVTAVTLGVPLIGSHADAEAVAGLLYASLPAERTQDEGVVFVGHGAATGAGSLAYPALQCFLTKRDPRLFVGTIEGPFDVRDVQAKLTAAKVKRVWLVPLLTVVGDHATNDIFGDEEGSWKQTFSKAGIAAVPVKQGLAEVPGLAALWADHADAALKELQE